MNNWKVEVRVWLKPSVFDPQGHAVEHALQTLGYDSVADVRIGKAMTLSVSAETEAQARAKVDAVCSSVLCNPVIETYTFELQPVAEASV